MPRVAPLRYVLFVAIELSTATSVCSASEIGVDLFGVSYHLDRRTKFGRRFNESNPGLGLNIGLYESSGHLLQTDFAAYEDSFKNTAKVLALGYHRQIAGGLYAGLHIALFSSESNSDGDLLIVPLPALAFRYKALTVNAVHLIEDGQINEYASFGFFLTIRLVKFGKTNLDSEKSDDGCDDE